MGSECEECPGARPHEHPGKGALVPWGVLGTPGREAMAPHFMNTDSASATCHPRYIAACPSTNSPSAMPFPPGLATFWRPIPVLTQSTLRAQLPSPNTLSGRKWQPAGSVTFEARRTYLRGPIVALTEHPIRSTRFTQSAWRHRFKAHGMYGATHRNQPRRPADSRQ